MTKRLSAGVVLAAFTVIFTAMSADAARPPTREWRGGEDPYSTTLPLFFRSSSGTTWLAVGGDNCVAADTLDSTHSTSQVWCFDSDNLGGQPDSTWPSRGSQGAGNWNHFSANAPAVPATSKWHITTRNVGAVQGGTRAAWAGCDSLGTNPSCTDNCFWTIKEGYGDDWDYPLELNMAGQNASTGGTIEFDIFYDSECNYDYTFLEYFNTATSLWQTIPGTAARPAMFNGVSGTLDTGHAGTGRPCGDDYFFASDQFDPGSGNILYYGNAAWLLNVSFPMPSQAGGLRVRWRCYSDGAWSDQDGAGDTDGIARIDNVTVTFSASGSIVSDTFESGNFTGVTATIGAASWVRPNHVGNPFDGWHIQSDPTYKNKGNTCEFSNDWMWASRPTAGHPATTANTFSYFLVTPRIRCDGWTGAVVEYAGYLCAPDARNDFANTQIRLYDTSCGKWSLWNDFDGFITFGGCEFWNMNDTEDLSPFMGATVDSFQVSWQMLDFDQPGDLSWGFHANVNYLIDNVSIGNFDFSSTVFTTRGIDLLSDTFSLVDPAHTPFMQNSGEGAINTLAKSESLSVELNDVDGINAADVALHWRVGIGTPPSFAGGNGTWKTKAMTYSDPDPNSATDEGTYRGTFGNTTTEDYGAVELVPDRIWQGGQTVEYYIKAEDVLNNVTVFPATADDSPAIYFRFQVHPFNRVATGSINIMLVDDYTRAALDFENSTGFQPTGGAGFGDFTSPVFDQPENMVERALMAIYGGSEDFLNGVYGSPKWDIYNVQGAGSSVQREPRISSDVSNGLGGIAQDLGAPNYEAVIWLQGTFDAYSYADTTRIELKTFLDSGGKLFSTGDEVAFFLGAADSSINFLEEYFGLSWPTDNDDETSDRTLNVEGVGGTSLAGVKVGLYGDCPGIRHAFDKLTEAPDVPLVYTSTTLAQYQAASPNVLTNGRSAIVKNVRLVGGGVAVHCGFAIESLVSTAARACILSKVLATDFGVTAPFAGCVQSGTDAPIVSAGRFGFDLAQATPNPFKDATSIRFSVPGRTHVSIEVYNILGQKVRTLVDETFESNSYVREWDGRADTGAAVSSGIYFYKMVAGDFTATRKAVVLK